MLELKAAVGRKIHHLPQGAGADMHWPLSLTLIVRRSLALAPQGWSGTWGLALEGQALPPDRPQRPVDWPRAEGPLRSTLGLGGAPRGG